MFQTCIQTATTTPSSEPGPLYVFLSFLRIRSVLIWPVHIMFSTLAVAWITLNMTGQWCMLLLLCTYLLVEDLPGRKNAFMLNFLMMTFLVTIPPLLLWVVFQADVFGKSSLIARDNSFYAGQQDKVPSHWLCVTQSVLMDGAAPM